MKKLLSGLLLASLISLTVWAQDNLLREGHPDEYTVKKGDTLWDISNTFLASPWKWPEIWHANPQIENPHLIYPGDLIKLIYLDGQARITSERTLKLTPDGTLDSAHAISADAKLAPKIRSESIETAIPTIPLDRIDAFLSRSRIVDADLLARAPYMLAGGERRIIVGSGDIAYGRGNFSASLANYGIYRPGEVYKDPITKEVLGVYAQGVGSVNVQSLDGDVATLKILRAQEEIRIGDRLLPNEERSTQSSFFPSSPANETNGIIFAVEGGVSQVGKYNVVMINRGDREGLKIGNVLAVYRKGETVKDEVRGGKVVLPDARAGLVMVFRTFQKMSFGLVLESDRPLAIGDKVQNP
jgi:LysM domain